MKFCPEVLGTSSRYQDPRGYPNEMGAKPWFTELQLALITVYVIVAVDVFGLTLIVPVIVTYARYLGASEASVGYLYAVYSCMALLANFFVGRLSDSYGRRAVFLYCCVGAVISFVGSALSVTFVQFAICRGVSGLFTGTMGNAYAYIDDLVSEEDKPKYISQMTATLSTCFVIGPIIGGGFAAIDIRAPFVAAAAMAMLELVLIWFFVQDPVRHDKRPTTAATPLLQEAGTAEEGGEQAEGPHDAQEAPALRRADTMDSVDMTIGPNLGAQHAEESAENAHCDKSPEEEVPLNNTAATADSDITPERDISPWLSFPALLVGGLGTFLSSSTYCGMAILVPFLLMDPDFGVVSSSDDTDDLSSHDSKKLSLIIGYLLTILGTIQVIGMLALFPRVNKRLGLLFTGALGAFIYGGSFCFLVLVRSLDYLYPVVIGLAVGYSLCRPVYPAYLSLIAPKNRRGDYQAMSTAFIQVAWICAVALTQFWSYSHAGAILYSGGLSILNSASLLIFGIYTYRRSPPLQEAKT
jgi:MFS family permease